jgi:hypothetical protein
MIEVKKSDVSFLNVGNNVAMVFTAMKTPSTAQLLKNL